LYRSGKGDLSLKAEIAKAREEIASLHREEVNKFGIDEW
jgi:hypothetical protein